MAASYTAALRDALLAASGVTTLVGSSVFTSRADTDGAFPFIVIDEIASVTQGFSSDGRFPLLSIQVSSFSKVSRVAARAIGEAAWAAVFAEALVLTVSGRQTMRVRPETELILTLDDVNVHQAAFRVGLLSRA